MGKKAWTDSQEQLLITWAEKASGYAWLHQKSISYYKYRNLLVTIPAAILGYTAGSVTLLSEEHLEDPWMRGLIGMSAIISGLLSNFQDMFTFKEDAEKHRMAALRFLSFFREISCELSIDPVNRSNSTDYITMKRLEFDKMLEQSPNFPDKIIHMFNNKFKYLSFHKPDAVAGIQTIIPFGREIKYIMYKKNINLKEKTLLLRYFTNWKRVIKKKPKPEMLIEVTNSNQSDLSDIGNIELTNQNVMSENNKFYLFSTGTLSDQKRLLKYQNIKIRSNSNIDLEKGEK